MKHFFFTLLLLLSACGSEHGLTPRSEDTVFSPGTSVDALVVLDTSGSMLSDEEHVLTGTMSIGADLWGMDLDVNLAFTSSDASMEGWKEIDLDNPDVVDVIVETSSAMFSLPNDSGSGEAGLNSALSAADLHPGFFRDSSIKLVVFISDEHEQSDLTSAEFRDLWPHHQTYFLAIVGDYDEPYALPIPPNSNLGTLLDNHCSTEATPKYIEASDMAINLCRDTPWRIKDLLPQ